MLGHRAELLRASCWDFKRVGNTMEATIRLFKSLGFRVDNRERRKEKKMKTTVVVGI